MIWAPLIVIAIVGALAMVPRFIENRRIEIGPHQRKGSTGKSVRLSQGVTHYQWHGGTRGKVIVAIHGLTTPSVIWDTVSPGLIAMGYRVLTYDLYGRGLSDAPGGPQDRHFFLRQLHDLLHHEGLDQDVTLLGYSMGGTIATAFAQEQPHRVAQVLLVAPSGIVTRESAFSMWCRRVPYVGDWLHAMVGARRMKTQLSQTTNRVDVVAVHAVQLAQLERQGYLSAVLSSRRGMLNETLEQAHRSLAETGIPVAAVWGDMDQVVPVSALGVLTSWNKETRQDVVKGADHSLPFTHGPAVSDALQDLLKRPDN